MAELRDLRRRSGRGVPLAVALGCTVHRGRGDVADSRPAFRENCLEAEPRLELNALALVLLIDAHGVAVAGRIEVGAVDVAVLIGRAEVDPPEGPLNAAAVEPSAFELARPERADLPSIASAGPGRSRRLNLPLSANSRVSPTATLSLARLPVTASPSRSNRYGGGSTSPARSASIRSTAAAFG